MKFAPTSSFFHVFMVGLGRCCGAIVTGVVGSLVRPHERRFSVDWCVNLLSAS